MTATLFRGSRWPGDVRIDGSTIAAVGPAGTIEPQRGDVIVDCTDQVITAGFVNTHHHLYQWMTRGWATGCDLFTWLTTLYPIWGRQSVEDGHAAADRGLGYATRFLAATRAHAGSMSPWAARRSSTRFQICSRSSSAAVWGSIIAA